MKDIVNESMSTITTRKCFQRVASVALALSSHVLLRKHGATARGYVLRRIFTHSQHKKCVHNVMALTKLAFSCCSQ